jgi:hypothetical protein
MLFIVAFSDYDSRSPMTISKSLRSDDCGRGVDRMDGAVEAVFNFFAQSFTLLTSPPSTLTIRGLLDFPRIVPLYLESSSVALCFFLRTTLR